MTCPKCQKPLKIDHAFAYCESCGYEKSDYQPPVPPPLLEKTSHYKSGYYAANRERLTASAKKWREEHREHLREYQVAYYWANRERVLENQRRSRERLRQ